MDQLASSISLIGIFAVGLSVLAGAACAGKPLEKAPLLVTLGSKAEKGGLIRLDEQTESLSLKIKVREIGKQSLRQRFAMEEELIPSGGAQLRIELEDLPITIDANRVKKGVWELELPPNVLQLLAKGNQDVQYTGKLVLDSFGDRSIPVTLKFDATPKRKPPRRSAG